MSEKGSREQIRQQNRDYILSTLRKEKLIARIELGQITGLSPATVTSITADLLELGLIVEHHEIANKEPKGRGRPRCMLGLQPNVACIVSVKLSVDHIQFLLCNFAGQITQQKIVNFSSRKATREHFTQLLIEELQDFLDENPIEAKHLAEIGLAVQGVVDTQKGTIVWSPALTDRDIDIVRTIKTHFGVNCLLSNDTNMIAEALYRANPNKYGENFVVIYMDQGVGAGFIIDGQLYTGQTGAAAEFGHSLHIPDGALCSCGRRGCLEAYMGDYAIIRQYNDMPVDSAPQQVGVEWKDIEEIIQAARAGNEKAKQVFSNLGKTLGIGITRLIALLDIKKIYLTGRTTSAYDLMQDSLVNSLDESLVSSLDNELSIEVLQGDESLIERGIVAKAMQRLDKKLLAKR
ncbi:ROK family protein [Polycladidibacter stylochi]|uniref:ROK family protein n=1 Tax=Polycladidibacter stylochi TaxID=1807766 RepID=UPI00138F0E4E|nr:ROK family protein [Pseudovibrio stylochi]